LDGKALDENWAHDKIHGNFHEHEALELQERAIYRNKSCSVDVTFREQGFSFKDKRNVIIQTIFLSNINQTEFRLGHNISLKK